MSSLSGASASMISITFSVGSDSRYGRSAINASQTSATARMRAWRESCGADQAQVVAAAVEPLVVRGGHRREVGEGGDPAEDLGAVARVLADHAPLLVGQLVGLVEDRVRDAELADVVQQAGAPHVAHVVVGSSITREMPTAIVATPSE